MTLIRDLSLQGYETVTINNKPPPGTWSAYQIFAGNADSKDHTAGIKLWSPGELVPFWTPGTLPDGITRAMRHSPSPAQIALGMAAYRPRSQANFLRSEVVGPNDAGINPNEAADGYVNTRRVMQFFILFPPDFRMVPAPYGINTAITNWHGGGKNSIGTQTNGLPNMQMQIHYNPALDKYTWTANIYGGRWQTQKIQYTALDGRPDAVFPEPAWAWDDISSPYVDASDPGVSGSLAFMESMKNFDLLNGEEIERGKWYKVVVEQFYSGGNSAETNVWIEGVKRVGPGGQNARIGTNYTGPLRTLRPATPDLFMPNLWIEPDGIPQQSRMEQTMYAYNEDPKKANGQGWYNAAQWDELVWKRAIWYAGSAIYNSLSDVDPESPAVVQTPTIKETWQIVDVPTTQRVQAASFDESWDLLDSIAPHVSLPGYDMLLREDDAWTVLN